MGGHQDLGQAATVATPSSVSQLGRPATSGAETSSIATTEIEKVVMVTPRKRKPRRPIGFAEDDEPYEPGPPSKRRKAASVKAKQAKATPKEEVKPKQKAWFTIAREKVEAELDQARADLARAKQQARADLARAKQQARADLARAEKKAQADLAQAKQKARVDIARAEQNTDIARTFAEGLRAELVASRQENLELLMRTDAQLAQESGRIAAVEEELRVLKEKARDHRQDRDAQASLLPISHKTEVEYLQDLLALNQEISDVSRQLAPPRSKPDRERLQALLTEQLWNKVFSVLVLGEDDADDEVLKSFHRGLQGNARTMFQGLLYASENVRSRDHDTITEEFCRRILEESPELRSIQDIQTVIQMAVRLHWAMSSEVKQARLVYFSRGSVFDAGTMHTRGQSGAAVAAGAADQNVERCLGFGFYGSAGTLEKALVTIEEDCL